nr:MAG TPA: hypothetical protein [Inoviridae sp.]
MRDMAQWHSRITPPIAFTVRLSLRQRLRGGMTRTAIAFVQWCNRRVLQRPRVLESR